MNTRVDILVEQDEDEMLLRALAMSLEEEEVQELQLGEQIPFHLHEKERCKYISDNYSIFSENVVEEVYSASVVSERNVNDARVADDDNEEELLRQAIALSLEGHLKIKEDQDSDGC